MSVFNQMYRENMHSQKLKLLKIFFSVINFDFTLCIYNECLILQLELNEISITA